MMNLEFTDPEILVIRGRILEHSRSTYEDLEETLRRHPDFKSSTEEYKHRILLLYFKTQLGDNELLWKPLFKEMQELLSVRVSILDEDFLWDAILSVGDKDLVWIRMLTQSHAGKFDFPLPILPEA
jgi:hypothetical protein